MLTENEALEQIRNIFVEDAGNRGIGNIMVPNDFQDALKDLLASKRIMILTGFLIKDAGVGETDGPLGSLSIGKALEDLGKRYFLLLISFRIIFLKKEKSC